MKQKRLNLTLRINELFRLLKIIRELSNNFIVFFLQGQTLKKNLKEIACSTPKNKTLMTYSI